MIKYYLVKGEADEETVDAMLIGKDPSELQIEWDSFYEGITTVCIRAESITEAADIAKKFYGFKNCDAELWEGFC